MIGGPRRGEAVRRTEQEIAAEKAAALGRAGERVEHALADARRAAQRLLEARGAAETGQRAEDYKAARARALDARLGLLIQREALGLRRHGPVDQQFPEPPPLTAVLRQKEAPTA